MGIESRPDSKSDSHPCMRLFVCRKLGNDSASNDATSFKPMDVTAELPDPRGDASEFTNYDLRPPRLDRRQDPVSVLQRRRRSRRPRGGELSPCTAKVNQHNRTRKSDCWLSGSCLRCVASPLPNCRRTLAVVGDRVGIFPPSARRDSAVARSRDDRSARRPGQTGSSGGGSPLLLAGATVGCPSATVSCPIAALFSSGGRNCHV